MRFRHHKECDPAPVIDINVIRNMPPEERESLRQTAAYAAVEETRYHNMRVDALIALGYLGLSRFDDEQ